MQFRILRLAKALPLLFLIATASARADYGEQTFESGEERGNQFRMTGLYSSEGSQWLEDRSRAEGPGIKLGNFELHPGFGAEFGYDSNIFFNDENEVSSTFIRLVPHLKFTTLGGERAIKGESGGGAGNPPTFAFAGALSGAYFHYFEDRTRDDISSNINLKLFVLPQRPVNLVFRENFTRTIRPFTQNPTGGSINYARDLNEIGADVFARSKSNVLEGNIGYTFGYDYFEGEFFRYNTSMQHRVNANLAWKFFPYTALLFQNEVQHINYTHLDNNPIALLSDTTQVRSLMGLNGALTPFISLTGMIGFSAGFYDEGDEYNGVIGRAEARFLLSPTASIATGYSREYQRSFIGNYFREDRIYVYSDWLLARMYYFRADASMGFVDYGRVLNPAGADLGTTASRNDLQLMLSGFAEYRISDIFGINGTLRYVASFTDYEFNVGTTPVVDPARFKKFEAIIGARVYY